MRNAPEHVVHSVATNDVFKFEKNHRYERVQYRLKKADSNRRIVTSVNSVDLIKILYESSLTVPKVVILLRHGSKHDMIGFNADISDIFGAIEMPD